jgi:glycosyltransferase involved in cell wall biosynthesis
MGKFYSNGHIYLNFSSSEGTPMPLLEAMACGRPVITTNVGISEEVVSHGENGWVIPRTLTSLIEAIDECRMNMSDLQMMGIKAFQAVEDRTYDWSAMYYEKLFDSVYDS